MTGETVVQQLRESLANWQRQDETTHVEQFVCPLWAADALLEVVEAAQALYDTHEIQMYVGHEAVTGGHIGYCSRTLGSKLAALHTQASDEGGKDG